MTHTLTEEERSVFTEEFLNKISFKLFDRSEAETIINFQRYDDNSAYVWTTDMTVYNKLKKNVISNPSQWKVNRVSYIDKESFEQGKLTGIEFCCPKRFVTFRAKSTGRTLSDSEREAIKERLAAARAASGSAK